MYILHSSVVRGPVVLLSVVRSQWSCGPVVSCPVVRCQWSVVRGQRSRSSWSLVSLSPCLLVSLSPDASRLTPHDFEWSCGPLPVVMLVRGDTVFRAQSSHFDIQSWAFDIRVGPT